MDRKEFVRYVWSFYGPRQLYGEYFGHSLELGEVEEAVDARMRDPGYAGDSVDREAVRDLMLEARARFLAKWKEAV